MAGLAANDCRGVTLVYSLFYGAVNDPLPVVRRQAGVVILDEEFVRPSPQANGYPGRFEPAAMVEPPDLLSV